MNLLKIIYITYVAFITICLFIIFSPLYIYALSKKEIDSGNFIYSISNKVAIVWCILVGIKYEEFNKKNIPNGSKHIYIANHNSYLDSICILRSINDRYRVLGRSDLSTIPIFGIFYRKSVLLIDRTSSMDRAYSVRKIANVLKNNLSVFIFPEGTFNYTNLPLKSFHDGAFKIAIKNKIPIQPLLFLDTLERMPNDYPWKLNPGICRVIFLEEFLTEDYSIDQIEEIKEKIYNNMSRQLLIYKSVKNK